MMVKSPDQVVLNVQNVTQEKQEHRVSRVQRGNTAALPCLLSYACIALLAIRRTLVAQNVNRVELASMVTTRVATTVLKDGIAQTEKISIWKSVSSAKKGRTVKRVPKVASHAALDSTVNVLENAQNALLDSTKVRKNKLLATSVQTARNQTAEKQDV
jgi:hypothetical protein